MIRIPALRLVLIDVSRCPFCGATVAPHAKGCLVDRGNDLAIAVADRSRGQDRHEPTSLELYNEARAAGATVGHQWAEHERERKEAFETLNRNRV